MESFKFLLMFASALFIARPYDINALVQDPDCKADVEFVLDHSSSIKTEANINKMWDFVRNVVQRYPLSSDGIYVGVIYFSDNPTNMMELESRTSTSSFIDDFNEKLKSFYWNGGDTYTNKALKLAEDQLFKEDKRKDVRKHIILVTDGGQSGGLQKELHGIADRLKSKDVTIIGFGIGSKLKEGNDNAKQLKRVTGGSYHLLNDFDALHEHLKNVTLNCGKEPTTTQPPTKPTTTQPPVEPTTTQPPPPPTCVDEVFEEPVDVAFLIDSSEKASYFEREIDLVKAIVKAFKIKLAGNRAGLISYGSAVAEAIELDSINTDTVEKFNQAVSNLKKEGGKPSIDKAMERAFSLLTSRPKKRQKLVLAFTDGNMSGSEADEALKNTELLKTKIENLRVIFIAMGDGTVSRFLEVLRAEAGAAAPIVKPDRKKILDELCTNQPTKPECPTKIYTCKEVSQDCYKRP